MKIITILLTAISIMLITGCAGIGQMGGNAIPGGLYSSVDVPGEVTKTGNKTGEACATPILGWIATGDSSIKAAMNAGGLTEVSSVEFKIDNVLGVYASYCTLVSGT